VDLGVTIAPQSHVAVSDEAESCDQWGFQETVYRFCRHLLMGQLSAPGVSEVSKMSQQESTGPPAPQQGRGAIRLIFEYDGDEVRLISRQHVDMLVSPSDALEGYEGQQGFWAEVRDADGTRLYRQILHDPIRRDAEVFSDDPQQSIARVPVERPTGVFFVLVPDLDEADHVALMNSPSRPPGLRAAATETLRVPLRQDQYGGTP
jgi:hypothetical protein